MTPTEDETDETHRGEPLTPASISDDEQFHDALRRLVTGAAANGVDVRGGWAVAADEGPSWDVEITRLADRSRSQAGDIDDIVPAIIEAVAAREGVTAEELPALYDTIDPDLLESLYDPDDGDHARHVTFQYCGYGVTVHADGWIYVDE